MSLHSWVELQYPHVDDPLQTSWPPQSSERVQLEPRYLCADTDRTKTTKRSTMLEVRIISIRRCNLAIWRIPPMGELIYTRCDKQCQLQYPIGFSVSISNWNCEKWRRKKIHMINTIGVVPQLHRNKKHKLKSPRAKKSIYRKTQ
jgi:hypothetical protein